MELAETGELQEVHSSRYAKLQKVLSLANKADLFLDQRQDFEGALRAYLEACSFLQHMICDADEDGYRWMLEAIWSSYMSRIAELQQQAWKSAEDTHAIVEQPSLETAVEYVSFQQLKPKRAALSVSETEGEPPSQPGGELLENSRGLGLGLGSPGPSPNPSQTFPEGTNTPHADSPANQDELSSFGISSSETIRDLVPEMRNHQTIRASFASTLISDAASRCSTIDSFKTAIASRATSTTLSFISAVSVLSFDRLGTSRSRMGHRFRDLLERPHGGVIGHNFDSRRSIVLESRPEVPPKPSRIDASSKFNENDWCGRGMHVDFEDEESIPLESLDYAGRGVTASVDIVRCRRVRLARKIVKLPPSRKVTEQLLQEVRTLHRVSHAHVVRLVGTYIHKRNFATLLYPAAEMNLEEYMQEAQEAGPVLSNANMPPDVCEVLSEGSLCLTSGLRFLHRHGINHSDIKPANIILKKGPLFFDKSYKMYLCDFGISRILDPNGESQTEEDRGKTPRYASPEVMKWDPHGRASDMFSLGYVLAEMATVYSGRMIQDFRNYIQEIGVGSDPFRAYHTVYKPEHIHSFLAMSCQLRVPNDIICAMVNEDPKSRPRLVRSEKHPDALVYDVHCTHNHDGPAAFQVG